MRYQMLPQILLRVPYLSFTGYDPDQLSGLLQQSWFRNALLLASPEFYQALSRRGFLPDQLSDKEWFTLVKYYNRMCFRPTPFGAFAGVSSLTWGAAQPVILATRGQSILHLLPDMRKLAATLALQPDMPLTINGTLYQLGSGYRYLMRSTGPDGRHVFHLQELEGGKLNAAMFRYLRDNPGTVETLTEWLCTEKGCARSSVGRYIRYLVEEQVLLTPAAVQLVTCGAIVPGLQQQVVDEVDPGVLSGASHKSGKQTSPVYACLERPVISGCLDENLRQALLDCIGLLRELDTSTAPDRLSKLKRLFLMRYENRRIPLMQLFDPDTGWEYGAPALDNIGLEQPGRDWPAGQLAPAAQWIIEQVTASTRRDPHDPVILKAIPAGKLKTPKASLPQTLAVLFRKHEHMVSIDGFSSVSATQLSGRFSLFSEPAWAISRDLASREAAANADVIFADIVHRSDDRVDNINRRRNIYSFHIDVDGSYKTGAEGILRTDDLVISLQQGEFILESLKLRKRIVPRLSTAYHYTRSNLPVFQFLGDLQGQGIDQVQALNLERLMPGHSFYPRVVFGQTVLSAARWLIKADEWPELFTGRLPTARFQEIRYALRLPDLLAAAEADMYLVFDISRGDDIALLVRHLAGRRQISLVEYLKPDRTVRCDGEPLAAQFMAFFAHGQEIYRKGKPVKGRLTEPVAYGPGSEWLYLKLYCSTFQANALIAGLIPALLKRFGRYINDWFFIRYTDPEHHVRIRFRLSAPAKTGAMLVAVNQWLLRNPGAALLQNLLVDTYRPERERYGLVTMPLVEAVFRAGSELALGQIAGEQDGETAVIVTAAVCFLMVSKLIDLPAARQKLTDTLFLQFYAEFGGNKTLLSACSSFYRDNRNALERLSGRLITPDADEYCPGISGLARTLTALKSSFPREQGEQLNRLTADLVHMQINRMLISDWRRHELSVWFLLNKLFNTPKLG